jgi:hypothetical protein
MQSVPSIRLLQGSKICEAPDSPGLYAWYFRPVSDDASSDVAAVLTRLLGQPPVLNTQINMRYRVRWSASHPLSAKYGASGKTPEQVLTDLVSRKGHDLAGFFRNHMVPYFARPIYIGIASRSLYERVYENHYQKLNEYWSTTSKVHKYLIGDPVATVQDVIDKLGEKHTFALEARVGGITPNNLAVFTLPMEEILPATIVGSVRTDLEELEDVLQLLADPLCGRE